MLVSFGFYALVLILSRRFATVVRTERMILMIEQVIGVIMKWAK